MVMLQCKLWIICPAERVESNFIIVGLRQAQSDNLNNVCLR